MALLAILFLVAARNGQRPWRQPRDPREERRRNWKIEPFPGSHLSSRQSGRAPGRRQASLVVAKVSMNFKPGRGECGLTPLTTPLRKAVALMRLMIMLLTVVLVMGVMMVAVAAPAFAAAAQLLPSDQGATH